MQLTSAFRVAGVGRQLLFGQVCWEGTHLLVEACFRGRRLPSNLWAYSELAESLETHSDGEFDSEQPCLGTPD